MHQIQFGIFKDFTPPAEESWFPFPSFNHLIKNILTVGIDAANQKIHHQYRIYELQREQSLLLKKAAHLEESWLVVGRHLKELIEEVMVSEGPGEESEESQGLEMNELSDKIQQLVLEKEELEEQPILKSQVSFFQSSIQKILSIFSFLGQLSANLSTLGLQGCYQNELLNKRVKLLDAQNQYLEKRMAMRKDEYSEYFQTQVALIKNSFESKSDLIGIQNTEPAKAYFEVADVKKQLQNLQIQEQDLQKQFDHLEVQYKTAKEAEDHLKVLRRSFDDLTQTNKDMQKKVDQLQGDQKDLEELRQQVQQAGKIGGQVQDLDKQFEGLLKRMGPIPPKYIPKQQELEDVEKNEEGDQDQNPIFSSFETRYEDCHLASKVFKEGFSYALKTLFDMADQGKDKIQLNRSLGTPASKGAQAVYRFLALDWIKGAKIAATCHGYYELHLNDNVKMISTQPENVLKYQKIDGKQQPVISLHFQCRDDFTPGEDELKHTSAACGMDPIAAKCLLAKLSAKEQEHLFNLLLEPVIADDNPDYQAALDYICKQPKKKQEEIHTLRDLISDMAIVLETKFRKNIAMTEWQQYLDVDDLELEPFIKKEVEEIQPTPKDQFDDQILIPWQVDYDVLGDGYTRSGDYKQADFLQLIMNAQEKHQIYFDQLKPELLHKPLTTGKVIENLTWDHLDAQYYKSHQLIGNQGCLFSNLLAVLMTNQSDLTLNNILKLRKAMAAYLDKPEYANEFKGAIKNDYNCTVDKFKSWLRGDNHLFDHQDLSPVVLEIAAFTFGVRIALFSPPESSSDFSRTKCIVDEYGRLVPVEDIEGHYFGPPTQEVLFMAVEDDYTFYGLFPKMKLGGDTKKLGINASDFSVIRDFDNYWKAIQDYS